MGTLVVVEQDPVVGTDKHNVAGAATPPPPGAPYAGIGDYDYTGSMTDQLADFLTIGGKPVVVVTSESSLDPGETIPPAGGHSGPAGSNFVPPSPAPVLPSLSITEPVGTGTPSANAGSSFVTAGGSAVLLDGDSIDTCDGLSVPMNSTVSAIGQDFVSCSG